MPFRLHCSALGQELARQRPAFKILNAWTPSRQSFHTLSTDFAFHRLTVVALYHVKYHSECTTTNSFKTKIRFWRGGTAPSSGPSPTGEGIPLPRLGTCEASWFDSISNRTSDSRFDSYWWSNSKFSNRPRCQSSCVKKRLVVVKFAFKVDFVSKISVQQHCLAPFMTEFSTKTQHTRSQC